MLVGLRVWGVLNLPSFGIGFKRRGRFRQDFPESVFVIRGTFNRRGKGFGLSGWKFNLGFWRSLSKALPSKMRVAIQGDSSRIFRMSHCPHCYQLRRRRVTPQSALQPGILG